MRNPKHFIIVLIVLCSITISIVFGLVYQKSKTARFYKEKDLSEDIKTLVNTLNKHRPLEGRLIGASTYYSYKPPDKLTIRVERYEKQVPNTNTPYASAEQASSLVSEERGVNVYNQLTSLPEVNEATKNISSSYLKKTSLESSYGLAVIDIFKGNYDSAIKSLEELIKKSSKDPKLLNDLACSYLAKFYDEDRPQDLIYALANIKDALNADPKGSFIEIRFNYALMLEKLDLKIIARQAWEDYLKIDSSSEWANEARSHIAVLDGPLYADIWKQERAKLEKLIVEEGQTSQTFQEIVKKYSNPSRVYVIEELLGDWGKAYLDNDKALAKQKLNTARAIGDILVGLDKDNLIRDMVAVIDKYSNRSEQLTELAKAHISCKQGIALIDLSEATNSLIVLNKALTTFNKLGDNAGKCLILLHICRCQRVVSKYDLALKISQQVRNIAKTSGYPYLSGRAWIQEANTYINLVNPKASLEAVNTAQVFLESINDQDDLVTTNVIFTLNYNKFHNLEESFKHIYKAIKYFNFSTKILLAPAIFATFRDCVILLGNPSVSIVFCSELINLLNTYNSKQYIALATAFYWRSFAYYKNNDIENAFKDLDYVKELLEKIEDKAYKQRLAEEVNIRKGDLYLFKNPHLAIDAYTKALDYFREFPDSFHKTHIYLSRSSAYLDIENIIQAETDLEEAIKEFEKERNNIKEEINRISFFENTVLAYEKMANIQLTFHKNVEKSFDYVEKAKARALLDSIEGIKTSSNSQSFKDSKSLPLTVKEIQKHLPENLAIIEYKIFAEQIAIWILQKDKLNFVQIPINNKSLDNLIDNFLSVIDQKGSKENLTKTSEPLYKSLIEPTKQFINKETVIVFIPDKNLNLIPFAALINPETKKYLTEEHLISYSPSATIFVRCLQKSLKLATKNTEKNTEKALIIGNPKFETKDFPKLNQLRFASQEAKEIALTYKNSLLFPSEKATKKAFLENAANYDVIHFAGHAIVNENSNLFSLLILASDKQNTIDKGALYAYEIYNYRFIKTRLIVLAACRTASGKGFQGEGVTNLARPFLASGIPSVVASLWNANDEASAKLFTSFHKERAKGKSSIEALRIAQIELITSSDIKYKDPKSWAPFMLLGSTD
ncbi:MAG: CHAT domain-containing protein [Acidobacteria bacterium]|nr:CHAT domain-containing protein [Acidobacteriota bacterium]